MGTGYTRKDTSDNISDGNIINASDLDLEFDGLQSAFDNTTGHTHDGTDGEGAPIEKVGPAQDIVVTATALRPKSDNTVDLGTSLLEFKDLYIDGTAYLDSVDIDGGSVTGLAELTVDNLSLNGNTITTTDTDGNLNLRANGDGIISVDATDVNFGDNAKAIFGAGSDLQIHHDGSNSYIQDTGSGSLFIRGSDFVLIQAADGTNSIVASADSEVTLYHNGSAKLATTSTGVDVTGDLEVSNDIDVSNNILLSSDLSKIKLGADNEIVIEHSHDTGLIFSNENTTDNQEFVLTLKSNEDTVTSGEALGRLNFASNSSAGGVSAQNQASIRVDATNTYSSTVAGSLMEFYTTTSAGALTLAMTIDDEQNITTSANVGIGTTDPSAALDVVGNAEINGNVTVASASPVMTITETDANTAYRTSQLGVETGNFLIQTRNSAGTFVSNDYIITKDAAGANSQQWRIGNTAKLFLNTNGLGVNTTSPSATLDVVGDAEINGDLSVSSTTPVISLLETDTGNQHRILGSGGSLYIQAQDSDGTTDGDMHLTGYINTDLNLLNIKAATTAINGRVGIGTSSPDYALDVEAPSGDNSDVTLRLKSNGTGASDALLILDSADTGVSEIKFRRDGVDNARLVQYDNSGDLVLWNTSTANNVFAKITPDGSFIVDGTSTGTSATNYLQIDSNGYAVVRVNGDKANTSGEPGGAALQLSVDSAAAVQGVVSYTNANNDSGYGTTYTGTLGNSMLVGTIQSAAVFFGVNSIARLRLGTSQFYPVTDNSFDLGTSGNRYDDIYATNGTIQTSDRNEKQDIEVLSDAETRVAQACKGLLRKFRWQDAVAEKGDDARIHFGIIAQDLQDAFTAEGLDAGRYSMFISGTWWETQTEIPAVDAVEAVDATYDEDGNELTPAVEAVEAKEAYTHTNTYETQEEAPEGATERTRLGVRYPELLAFIIAAI